MGKTKAELERQIKNNRRVIDTQIETLDEYRKTIKKLEYDLKRSQTKQVRERKKMLHAFVNYAKANTSSPIDIDKDTILFFIEAFSSK